VFCYRFGGRGIPNSSFMSINITTCSTDSTQKIKDYRPYIRLISSYAFFVRTCTHVKNEIDFNVSFCTITMNKCKASHTLNDVAIVCVSKVILLIKWNTEGFRLLRVKTRNWNAAFIFRPSSFSHFLIFAHFCINSWT
jgi:hypothetical protein